MVSDVSWQTINPRGTQVHAAARVMAITAYHQISSGRSFDTSLWKNDRYENLIKKIVNHARIDAVFCSLTTFLTICTNSGGGSCSCEPGGCPWLYIISFAAYMTPVAAERVINENNKMPSSHAKGMSLRRRRYVLQPAKTIANPRKQNMQT